eukprot:CAMPEP_0177522142 /NCGR_PEP_ID=MMETSP0369-20130122/48619_1 /TAXON_ID=447022 ORGANISM="Scrippsiella hangoei-like, Strain SHHI-4" /NCGR_SAMPLE_ID=MMETSP0369 /ASSEMBLY_ACC=CAM_ASM_000364 /LENGTH=78 /DNA_ID=CAMNT_0019001733 /DNA_START=105 /DNA_END=338 /DNA_ORIENTATION=-
MPKTTCFANGAPTPPSGSFFGSANEELPFVTGILASSLGASSSNEPTQCKKPTPAQKTATSSKNRQSLADGRLCAEGS